MRRGPLPVPPLRNLRYRWNRLSHAPSAPRCVDGPRHTSLMDAWPLLTPTRGTRHLHELLGSTLWVLAVAVAT